MGTVGLFFDFSLRFGLLLKVVQSQTHSLTEAVRHRGGKRETTTRDNYHRPTNYHTACSETL